MSARVHPGLFCVGLAAMLYAGTAQADGLRGKPWQQSAWSLGGRLTSLELRDVESGQQLPMGGAGFVANYRMSPRWGLELAIDIVGADELGQSASEEVVRITTPMTVSGQFFLFPQSRLQMYLLAGVGVAGHSVRYSALGEESSFGTPVFQLGLGARYHLDSTVVDISVRSLMMSRRGDEIDVKPLDDGERKDVDYQPLRGDRQLQGAMLTVGLSWGL